MEVNTFGGDWTGVVKSIHTTYTKVGNNSRKITNKYAANCGLKNRSNIPSSKQQLYNT